ncbi:DUF262 domain-containing protein [Paramuribaculum intestinale]|uniref:DUF262 domain-containing protein n=3 Tax=Paramuribaculum intestinale TaxID=2094151 RepID=UPI0025A6211F|nr:DUF262 domain-containing protein [Paramuribaculum intestinale]
MDSKPKKNIRDYFRSNPRFLIPAYQRGYKWGVCGTDGSSAAKSLVIDIKKAFEADKRDEYFIQGVTGYKKDDIFYLIDGQQRTTTLFLLIALLADKHLRTELLFDDKGNELRLIYFGKRNTSAIYLEKLCRHGIIHTPTATQDTQDVHFLYKAAKEMESQLPTAPDERQKLLDNILDKVFIFQIEVSAQEAPNVFSMMNGNKADMKIEELIKAQYLSGLTRIEDTKSVQETENVKSTLRILEAQIADATAREWKINASRSRLAREWDKWVYWWMRPEVRSFYHTSSNDMTGWLIPLFCKMDGIMYDSSPKVEIRNQSFNAFSEHFLTSSVLNTSYESIRRLQKRMEDLYENTTTYNLLGFLLDILTASERADVIKYFLDKRSNEDYLKYALFRMATLTHNQAKERIEGKTDDDAYKSISNFVKFFEEEEIYDVPNQEWSNRYLFFCNVMAAEERNAKFEFWYHDENGKLIHYWTKKSIEHIWPKSKVSPNGGNGNVSRILLNESEVSEHMLGNLVFLHTLDNTRFKDKTPTVKRQRYFDLRSQDEDGKRFYSRGMLHTMAAFGGEEWEKDIDMVPQIIKKRHTNEIKILRNRYGFTE